MKQLIKWLVLLYCSMSATMFVACGDDGDDSSLDKVVGSWYGTRVYQNNGANKYQWIIVTFESNATGHFEYESPVSYSVANFSYRLDGNTIHCYGAYASTYGDVEDDFSMTFKIEGDRLIPVDKYTNFILTRDNSVMTDGNGNELIDNSELLYGVWLHSSGDVVLVLSKSNYVEYTLLSASSNIYSRKTEGTFSYDLLNKYVLINGVKYNVTLLSETDLQLKSEKNVIFNYKRGKDNDIPTNGQNSSDYVSILENPKLGWYDKNSEEIFNFYGSGKITYMEKSTKQLGSHGYVTLCARGTYSLSGKTINCIFNDVSWESGASIAKDYFPGWTYGKTCYKSFIIERINVENITLSKDGKTYNLYPI